MTSGAAPLGLRGPTLAVAVVALSSWLSSTLWVLASGHLDLGFTIDNVAWRLANAWLLPTVLVVLGAAAVRSRTLAGIGLAAAVAEALAFAAIVVVQLVLGARSEFVQASLLALPTTLLAAIACVIGVVGARRAPRSWGLALAVAVAAAVGVAVVEVRGAARGLVGFGPLEPLALVALALLSLTSLAVLAALALLASPRRPARWASASLLLLAALLSLPGAVGALLGGLARAGDAAQQVLGLLGLVVAAILIVLDARRPHGPIVAQAQPAQAQLAQPQPAQPQPMPSRPRSAGAPPLPPPAPGTQVPPPTQ